jgi:hypothetical protein
MSSHIVRERRRCGRSSDGSRFTATKSPTVRF